ncbi:MAG TPA: ABC transporter permease [Candidatus Lachnoclostridium avicola]|nr:ABC transporter permease [Candidatus Lachnoclostridium avicola]
MSHRDLVRVCLQNLLRHKARTFLTVMGVVLGCCSVIIMISIGIGMKKSQEQALSMMGDLTVISVYKTGRSRRAAKITAKTMEEIRAIPGVQAATPKLSADQLAFNIYAGPGRRYRCVYLAAVGLEAEAAKEMGYHLTEGQWKTSGQNHVLVGQNFEYLFEDTKRPEGRNMREPGEEPFSPYFDSRRTKLTLEAESGRNDGKKLTWELTADGRLKEDFAKGMETSMGILFRLEDLQRIMDEQQRASGKIPDRRKGWDNAVVKADDIRHVASIEKQIRKMGLSTSSMESIRKPMEQDARQKQMMLGCLGAISLFVAALGITNTMVMSISERTREIGVMKALGCRVKDVRRLFLMEAACIGLTGGILGMGVSYGVSALMNLAAAAGLGGGFSSGMEELLFAAGPETAMPVSVIPWWLALAAVAFSVLIGLAAGYYPAGKAVAVPALEAIKRD